MLDSNDWPTWEGPLSNGMIPDGDGVKPGAILQLWTDLRRHTGVVHAKKKEGVRFKVRSAEDLIDKVRDKANELGILIYPCRCAGKGHVVEEGTLAEVSLEVVAQAVSDGSRLVFAGYGLGADTQDKAGGKAGTYAFKQALLQALLAGGARDGVKVPDTDDTDSPIEGGVRPKVAKVKITREELEKALGEATDQPSYRAAVARLMLATPELQVEMRDLAFAAKARVADKV